MKTTPHSALRAHALKLAQRENPDVLFEVQVSGHFKTMDGKRTVVIGGGGDKSKGAESPLDLRIIVNGSTYAEVDWKVGDDDLRPSQVTRIANLTRRRVFHRVVHAESASLDDINRAAREFSDWVRSLPRR